MRTGPTWFDAPHAVAGGTWVRPKPLRGTIVDAPHTVTQAVPTIAS